MEERTSPFRQASKQESRRQEESQRMVPDRRQVRPEQPSAGELVTAQGRSEDSAGAGGLRLPSM